MGFDVSRDARNIPGDRQQRGCWRRRDSDPQPPDLKSGALPQLSYAPNNLAAVINFLAFGAHFVPSPGRSAPGCVRHDPSPDSAGADLHDWRRR